MSIKDKLESLDKGLEYGVGEALEFATQDHTTKPKIPNNIDSLDYFYVGRECGRFAGGLVYVPLIDILSLGVVPAYNIYRNKKLKKVQKKE